jgi:hypothetical protein
MTPRQALPRRPAGADRERLGERLIAIFCLGAVLFSPLVIGIFDRGPGVRIFGVPLLYFYLFAGWALLIVLLAFVIGRSAEARRSARSESPRERSGRDGEVR